MRLHTLTPTLHLVSVLCQISIILANSEQSYHPTKVNPNPLSLAYLTYLEQGEIKIYEKTKQLITTLENGMKVLRDYVKDFEESRDNRDRKGEGFESFPHRSHPVTTLRLISRFARKFPYFWDALSTMSEKQTGKLVSRT